MIYLNNAEESWPKPELVREVIARSVSEAARGRVNAKSIMRLKTRTQETMAALLGADYVSITAGATPALRSLLRRYDPWSVLTTDLEHTAVLNPLNFVSQKRDRNHGVEKSAVIVKSRNGFVKMNDIQKSLAHNTKLVVMAHASNVFGTVQDISPIGRYLERQGILFVVDGAQSAGAIPVDFSRLHCDFYVCSGHKWLFGLEGVGAVLSKNGFTGARYAPLPQSVGGRRVMGCANLAALCAGSEFVLSEKQIFRRLSCMRRMLFRALSDIKKLTVYGKDGKAPLVSFNRAGMAAERLGKALEKKSIIVRAGNQSSPLAMTGGCVRASFSYLNSTNDFRILEYALKNA